MFGLAWTAIVSRDIVGPAILLECRPVSCSTDRAKFFRYILRSHVSRTVVRYTATRILCSTSILVVAYFLRHVSGTRFSRFSNRSRQLPG